MHYEVDPEDPIPQFVANVAGMDYLELISSDCDCIACQFLQQLVKNIRSRDDRDCH